MNRKSISQLAILVLAGYGGLRIHRSWTDDMVSDEPDSGGRTKTEIKTKGSYRGVWENRVKMSALGHGDEYPHIINDQLSGLDSVLATKTCTGDVITTCTAAGFNIDGVRCDSNLCKCKTTHTGWDCGMKKSDFGEWNNIDNELTEYDPTKGDDLVTLDFVWLSGTYLLLALILVGIATIGDFTNFKGFERIMEAANNLATIAVQKSILTAIMTSFFDMLAVVLLAGSMLTFENVAPTGEFDSTGFTGTLLSTELIFSLVVLTVISRSMRAIEDKATMMSITVTIFTSLCIVIIVVDQWRQLPMITRMISRPQLLLLCSFEGLHIVRHLAKIESDSALSALKAFAVNMTLYVTTRMHANLRPGTRVVGSTRTQLGPTDAECNFLRDGMVKYDADSDISADWYSFRVGTQCAGGGGDYQSWPMLGPIVLVVAYCAWIYLGDMKVASRALAKFQTLYIPDAFRLPFRSRVSGTSGGSGGSGESYRRIRVI